LGHPKVASEDCFYGNFFQLEAVRNRIYFDWLKVYSSLTLVYFVKCQSFCFFLLCYRREKNRKRADDQLEKLKDALLLQQFFQDCDEVC